MKTPLCLILFFSLLGLIAHAQTNQFRDDKTYREKERKQIKKSNIKETRVYLFHYRDTLLGADSMLIGKYQYDKKGNLEWKNNYLLSQYGYKVPPVAANFIDLYDKNGNITQHSYFVIRHSMFQDGKIMPASTEDDQAVTYQYDSHNVLIKDVDHLNSFMEMGNQHREHLGTGTTVYSYDGHGNLTVKLSHDLDGKFTFRNEYTYSPKNELFKILTYIDSAAAPYVRQEYKYDYTATGLTKLESVYNNTGRLTAQREFVYDKQGNQLKGYNIVNEVRQPVWDYKYNKNNQVVESTGGPATRFGPGYKAYGYHFRFQTTEALGPADPFGPYCMDVRRDGFAHLFYFYDDDGNLTEIKKYEVDATGNESLSMAQKFVYIRY